jgi:hypothetical protein
MRPANGLTRWSGRRGGAEHAGHGRRDRAKPAPVLGVPGFSLCDAPVPDHDEHPISFTSVWKRSAWTARPAGALDITLYRDVLQMIAHHRMGRRYRFGIKLSAGRLDSRRWRRGRAASWFVFYTVGEGH